MIQKYLSDNEYVCFHHSLIVKFTKTKNKILLIKIINMEYKVIEEVLLNVLQNEINNHISSGWKLQGGISVSRARNNGTDFVLKHYQAIIKE